MHTLTLTASAAKLYDAERLASEFTLDELSEFVTAALQRPDNYIGFDERVYTTHAQLFATPSFDLTDDYPVGEANYRAALKLLTEEFPRQAEDSSFGHWTYSRYNAVLVQLLTKGGKITPAAVRAFQLAHGLQDYPLIDDEVYSEITDEIETAAMLDWAADYAHEGMTEYGLDLPADETEVRAWVQRVADAMHEWMNERGTSMEDRYDERWTEELTEHLDALDFTPPAPVDPTSVPLDIPDTQWYIRAAGADEPTAGPFDSDDDARDWMDADESDTDWELDAVTVPVINIPEEN
jgi:hypothetical protein